MGWLKSAVFYSVLAYLYYSFEQQFKVYGQVKEVVLFVLALISYHILVRESGSRDFSLWGFIKDFWKLAILGTCGYLLVTHGYLASIGLLFYCAIASLSIWLQRRGGEDPHKPIPIWRPIWYVILGTAFCLMPFWIFIYGLPLLTSDSAKVVTVPLGYFCMGLIPGLIAYEFFRSDSKPIVAVTIGVVSGILGALSFIWLLNHPWGGYAVQTTEYKLPYSIDYFSEGERAQCEDLRHWLGSNPSAHLDSNDHQTQDCVRRWTKAGFWKIRAKTP